MRLLILIFSLQISASIGFCAPAFSKSLAFQRQQPVSQSSNYYPTNIGSGYAPVFVYDADSLSASPVATWTDYNGGAYSLTNNTGKGPALSTAALNGHNLAGFNGVDMFMRAAHPDVSVPYEIIMVASMTNIGGSKYYIYTDNTPRLIIQPSSASLLQLNPGGTLTSTVNDYTNKYMVFNFVVWGTNSMALTNGVAMLSYQNLPSATNEFGNGAWSLGSYWLGSAGGFSALSVAWMALYPTNLATARTGNESGSVRSNLYFWATNRFGLGL